MLVDMSFDANLSVKTCVRYLFSKCLYAFFFSPNIYFSYTRLT